MQLFCRLVILLAAVCGGGLLLWKAWDGMFYFLYSLITSTLEPEQEIPLFLPNYLITAFGILLIALSQIGATWTLGPRLKGIGLFRGVLLLLSSAAFVFTVSRVLVAFQTLATSGSADPSSLASQLENAAPFFYFALGTLLLSTVMGVIGGYDFYPKSGGGILKGFETAAWFVSTLIVIGLTLNYIGIDRILAGGTDGSADPASLAGGISLNLNFQFAWSISLGLPGALAIAASLRTKPVKN